MKDPCEKDPCEDCMYEEGSPYCLQYCPYDAERKKEQEPCNDAISRKSIKQKLQEHHDFFVNAYGGFSNLPQNDKARVDEITNCIAMVVNEPPVIPQAMEQEPKTGHCEECKYFSELPYHIDILGKCIRHTGLRPRGDWYCADFEAEEDPDGND